ncbi:MAG: 30S ribosomal protein S6 [Gammaproteobacteria bacterium]|nr:30S ribosomal protein S6 [Gammaproteobacteria bacterium]
MRHYEIVILVHPDQSDQVPEMIKKYQEKIKSKKGVVHRLEDWGRRQLAYSIDKVQKAHYLLMNIECDQEVIDDLTNTLRFSDAILRHLIIKSDKAITKPSPMKRQKKAKQIAPSLSKKSTGSSESEEEILEEAEEAEEELETVEGEE